MEDILRDMVLRVSILESNIDSLNAIINNIQEYLDTHTVYDKPSNITTIHYNSNTTDSTLH